MTRRSGAHLGVGSVLGRSFTIWGRHLFSFSLLYALVFAPMIAYAILAFPVARESVTPAVAANRFVWYSLVLSFGSCLLWFIAPLAVIHGVLERLRGQRATIVGCLRTYFTRLFPALGAGILVGVLTFVGALLGAMVGSVATGGLGGPLRAILTLLPPTFVACVFWVVVPVAAAERRGLFGSLRRAAELTRGSRLRIFLVVLVSVLVQIAPLLVVRLAMPGATGVGVARIMLALTVVLGAYGAVVTSVAYHDLRAAKDGVGVEDLVKVFA